MIADVTAEAKLDELRLVIPSSGAHWHRTITRAEFEQLAAPLVERTLDACRAALSDAGLEPKEIDEVVLVGGSTRVPLVRERVHAFFGRIQYNETSVNGLGPDSNQAGPRAYQDGVENGLSLVRDRDEVFMTLRYTF